jgi:outer membrane protein assembly factor BamB
MEIMAITSKRTHAIKLNRTSLLTILILVSLIAQSCDDGRIEPFEIPVEKDNPLVWKAPVTSDTSYRNAGFLYYHKDKIILTERNELDQKIINCYSAIDGEKLWEWTDFDERDIDKKVSYRIGTGFADNFLYTLTDCFDYVIDIETGQLVWKYYNIHSNNVAHLSGSTLYRTRIYNDVPNNDSIELYATDIAQENWRHLATFHRRGEYKVELGSLTVDPYLYPDTILYFHVAYNDFWNHTAIFDLYAWNKSTNSLVWRKENIGNTNAVNIFPSIVDEEQVFFHCGNEIYAFDKFTGEPMWVNNLGYFALSSNWFKTGDIILTVTNLGEMIAINSTTGETVWRDSEHLPIRLVPFRNGVIFVDGKLTFADMSGNFNKYIMIYELDGTYNHFKTIEMPPAVDDKHQFVFVHDNKFIYCYDTEKLKTYN